MSRADPPVPPPRPMAAGARYGFTLLMVAAATVAALVAEMARVPNFSLVFVLPVVVAAVSFGWGAAFFAAAGGVLAYNYFLIEPRYTLAVAHLENVWALALLLAVGAIVSWVAGLSRGRAVQAQRAAAHAMALQALARGLVGASDRQSICTSSAEALSAFFEAPVVILTDEAEGLVSACRTGGADLAEIDREAAAWALASAVPTHAQTYPFEASSWDFWPVVTADRQRAVIGVHFAERPHEAAPLVEAVAGYLSVALSRERLMRQAVARELEREGERLKGDLLAAVSHDLKTPLSTILFTLQSLQRFAAEHDVETRAHLLHTAEVETARLSQMVAALLDMNRLDAGAVSVRPQAVQASELIDAALQRVSTQLGARAVRREAVAEPCLWADPELTSAALGNLLENAARYSPAGTPIGVRVGRADGQGWIEVEDEGPGFEGPVEPLFERFVRGVQGDGRPPGTGLGLSIARRFIEIQGGAVTGGNRRDRGGARMRISLPLAEAARSAA